MLQTPLHAWHVEHQGRMVDFAGWDMPVQYSTIVDEHQAVRTTAGLFDISHMGRLEFRGEGAVALLDRLVTNDVTKLTPGQIRYALVTNESGGILDDVLVYHLGDVLMLVVNASNRAKIVSWITDHWPEGCSVEMTDRTLEWAMVALQGPRAVEILAPMLEASPTDMKYYTGRRTQWNGRPVIVSRTGYTGEDGFELIVDSSAARELWNELMDRGGVNGIQPAGLGCRDTLRLEAAMPLYGHELSENVDPLTAGLAFGVKLQAGPFIGRDALLEIKAHGPTRQRVGLKLDGRRIAREHAVIFQGDTQVGEVTSGTFSPTLQQAIAMAYVPVDLAAPGTRLEVDIRGRRAEAEVVPLPFYRR